MANPKTRNRNLQSEAEWLKKNYKRFEAKLDKELGEEFAMFLKLNKTSFTNWVRDTYDLQLKEKKQLKEVRELLKEERTK
jgi:hypothetical protein